MALIANLIFKVIHKQVKECELFSTIIAMASANLGSYISLIGVIKSKVTNYKKRELNKIQLNMFQHYEEGCFQKNKTFPESTT